ncbi:MAG TPA: hypothetical protein VF145_11175 [Chitinophagaceae bacterium]
MESKNDNRFESSNKPRGSESKPAPPTSSSAENKSVYEQPPIEKATSDGKAEKMDRDCQEDRKHTP